MVSFSKPLSVLFIFPIESIEVIGGISETTLFNHMKFVMDELEQCINKEKGN